MSSAFLSKNIVWKRVLKGGGESQGHFKAPPSKCVILTCGENVKTLMVNQKSLYTVLKFSKTQATKCFFKQGCIFRLTCSYPELTEDHVLTMCLKEKRLFLTSLKQPCNEYLIKFSENQSAPKLENRKTSPCSPCAPNLLHVLASRILGYHNLCSPECMYCTTYTYRVRVRLGPARKSGCKRNIIPFGFGTQKNSFQQS